MRKTIGITQLLISIADISSFLSTVVAFLIGCAFVYRGITRKEEMVSDDGTTLIGGNFLTAFLLAILAFLPILLYEPDPDYTPLIFYTRYWIILLLEFLAAFIGLLIIKIPLNSLANLRVIPAFLAFFICASWEAITLEEMIVLFHNTDLTMKLLGIVTVVYLVVYFIAPVYMLGLIPKRPRHISN